MQELYFHNNNNNKHHGASMCKREAPHNIVKSNSDNINDGNVNDSNVENISDSDVDSEQNQCITFERRPSMYFLIEKETMLLFRLAGFKLKPSQQEKLYWNLLHLLNSLENEDQEMKTCHARGEKPKSHDTFDGGGYGIFWDEYHSIEQSKLAVAVPDNEDGSTSKEDKSEREIQWLNDVGFTNIAMKIRARHEIDQNDDDMKIIAASLTRAQATAVRRRIDSLNEAIRQRKLNDLPASSKLNRSTNNKQRRHVKDIFSNPSGAIPGSPNSGDEKRERAIKKDVIWKKQAEIDLTSKDMSKASDLGRSRSLQVRPLVPPKPSAAIPRQKSFGHSDILLRQGGDSGVDLQIGNGCVQHLATAYEQNTPQSNSTPVIKTPLQQQPDNLVRRTSNSRTPSTSDEGTNSPEHRTNNSSSHLPKDDSTEQFNFNKNSSRKHSNNSNDYVNESMLSKTPEKSPSPVDEVRTNNIQSIDNDNGNRTKEELSPGRVRKSSNSDNSYVQNNTSNPNSPRKRLVVVDSTYINVSTVEDSYTTVNRDNKPQMKKSHSQTGFDDSSSTCSSNAVYHDDNSLRPYDSSIDDTLPQSISNASSTGTLPRDETPPITDNSGNLITPDESFIEGNQMGIAKTKNSKRRSKNTEAENKDNIVTGKTKDRSKKDKEKRKRHNSDKSKSHKTKHKQKDDSIPNPNDSATDGRFNPLKNENITTTKLNSNIPSNSDDNRSIDSLGSVGSSDDSPLSFSHSRDFQGGKSKTSRLYASSTDSNCTTPEKGLNSIGSASDLSLSPRTQSPQCLEGDAKLNFGSSTTSPRDVERTPSDAMQEPNFPKLPNFTLTKEELGSTHVGDLAEADMVKIRSLALIELTALFDAHGISMNRRKTPTKLKLKDQGTFGVSLTTLCAREESKNNNPGVIVPRIFKEMLEYIEKNGLHERGLLRVPGSTPRVKTFKEEADKHLDLSTLKWEEKKITDISTCLKQFLRDLPVPLLSYEYQNTFTSVSDLPDRKVQLQALNLLVLLLHPVHQETLKLLLIFLSKVVINESHNKMGLNNVAMIMAPNLFFNNNAKININEAQKAAGMTDVLRMLIKYRKILWTIPAFMVSQIRFLYDAGAKTKDPKALSKLIRRKKMDYPSSSVGITIRTNRPGSSGEELEDFDENLIIRVKAPTLNKQSMAIQLSKFTTVAEIIAKFQWQRQKSHKEKDEIATDRLRINATNKLDVKKDGDYDNGVKFFLYEIGGNIGERRLEASACISAILKENPNAEWVLKSEPV